MASNPHLLAADNPLALMTLLRENPSIASAQDEHGYSLVHAAASYNHLELLRALIREFKVDVNLRDEDQETALFVVETHAAAKVLVEELHVDLLARNEEGQTASDKIADEADFPEVAQYLKAVEVTRHGRLPNGSSVHGESEAVPPLPEGLSVSVGIMAPPEDNEPEVDTEFRRRIEQLAERDDFHTEAGQAELRQLVQDAIGDQNLDDRQVRQRQA
ncbi:ankyrin repeat-containing protein [Truncatella angustata]|uniref:Ankyrin repeat-containing protein n=1 Tax=Truncatella angustata TaxID=152316 RepID=A0A9P8ZSX1_9PEZI|nr:ankyrin repeat-containing protein [Truncatella angustata]KAH6648232.1 ankyrin repeat-containing protein [Truncatella angustata]